MMTGAFRFRGRKILEALVVAFCAGDPFVLERIRIQRVILRTEKYISELPPFFFIAFEAVLYVLEYGFPPIAWKFSRFTKMPLEKQLAHLESWENSRFAAKRNLFKLVRAACVCQIFSEHRLLIDIGYGPALAARTGRKLPAPAKELT